MVGDGKLGISICIADDVKGPWERTIFPEYLYDPGLFFDEDGKVYVVHGQGTLYLTELNSDVKSVKGKPVKIWQGGFKNAHELEAVLVWKDLICIASMENIILLVLPGNGRMANLLALR